MMLPIFLDFLPLPPPCRPFYQISLWSNVTFYQIPLPLSNSRHLRMAPNVNCCHQIHAFFSKYGHFSPIHVAKTPKFYAYPRDYVIFQVDIKGSFRLAKIHQINHIQILFCSPKNTPFRFFSFGNS